MTHPLSRRLGDVLQLQPDAPALEYDGHWNSWAQVGRLARRIAALAARQQVGILLRNRPEHIAALLGVLLSGGCVVVINPSRGDERIRDELAALRLPVIVGEPGDVAHLVPQTAATTVVPIWGLSDDPHVTESSSPGRGAAFVVAMLATVLAGSTLDPELRHNMLGLTGTGSVLLLSGDETDQPEHRRGSFGTPAPGFECRVLDPEPEAPVGSGAPGELWVRGRYLMQRYYKRSREECFDADGWFGTGDLVAPTPTGCTTSSSAGATR
jgi:acyl-CoA synthetase (AMP-forming)/AMP-acid ligase II